MDGQFGLLRLQRQRHVLPSFCRICDKMSSSRLRIVSAQLPSRLLENFHASPPRPLPQVIGRQNSGRQQRIVRYRVEPRFTLRRRPLLKHFRGRFGSQCPTRPFAEDFQMPRITAVDAPEVPCAADDLRVRFPRARPRLQQDKRFHIDLPAAKDSPFFRQRIGRDPHAVLSRTTANRTNGISPAAGRSGIGANLFPHGLRKLSGVRCVGMNAERLGTQDDVLSGRGDYLAFVQ